MVTPLEDELGRISHMILHGLMMVKQRAQGVGLPNLLY